MEVISQYFGPRAEGEGGRGKGGGRGRGKGAGGSRVGGVGGEELF